MKKQTYSYVFKNGETIAIKAIPPTEYRLLSSLPEMSPPPVPPIDSYYHKHSDSWLVSKENEDPGYEEAMKHYGDYVRLRTAQHQHQITQFVINTGIVHKITEEERRDIQHGWYDVDDDQVKVEWVLDKCQSQVEFQDLIDAIVGINMPTETGVQSAIRSMHSIIIDNEEYVPIHLWESRKERKGGVLMSLYAEGIMACRESNGMIDLKTYFSLHGDPRYVEDNSSLPMSQSDVIGANRISAKSSNATQEIEMEDKSKQEFDPTSEYLSDEQIEEYMESLQV